MKRKKKPPVLITFDDTIPFGFLKRSEEASTPEEAQSLENLNRLARELAAKQAKERK